MDITTGRPFSGRQLGALTAFLAQRALRYAADIDFSVMLEEDGRVIGTGSLAGNVVKCVAVSGTHTGENLTATILTVLQREAFLRGTRHLFLYTKPEFACVFSSLGFFEIARTNDCLLLENVRGGITEFIRTLPPPVSDGSVGCIVANCNPFTRGHRYLIERAAEQCAALYVFVLSEDRSRFPASDRIRLVCEGTADLRNVTVHGTGGYMVSSATFPDYFLRAETDASAVHGVLDLTVFTRYFVKPLRISRRFVGTEPFSPVTAAYNRAMMDLLPPCGVEVVELPRFTVDGAPVSASRVRALLEAGNYAAVEPLVPPVTYRYLLENRSEL